MKTTDFIHRLSRDLKPRQGADSELVFVTKWLGAAALALTMWLYVLPLRTDLTEKISEGRFLFESALWIAMSIVTGLIAYRSRIPSLESRTQERIALALSVVLMAEICIHFFMYFSPTMFTQELAGEMSFYRGRCGPLIFIMGLSWSTAMFSWIKKGAPTQPARSGAWATFSAGCLAAFAMQFVCTHENTIHLMVWHLLPTAAIAAIGFVMGRRLLRW